MAFVPHGRNIVFEQFYPYEYAQSVFSIDYDKLYELGYRGLIFDVDNTLVHHGDPSTKEVDAFLLELQSRGFKVVLLSDNETSRLESFTAKTHIPFIPEAGKPSPKGYEAALEKLGLERSEAIVIGDQMFTDIRGANASGLASILVHYVTVPRQRIGKRRYVEKALLALWRKSERLYQRLGSVERPL